MHNSGPDGQVEVGVDTAAGTTRLTVTDNGPGIDAALRSRLFEPFSIATPSGGDPGVGLGLLLARGLTEAMGGQLTIEDNPTGGTVATVAPGSG